MQMAAHCLIFALLNVLVSTVAFIPLMLYYLNLNKTDRHTPLLPVRCMCSCLLCLQMAAHCLIFASLNVLVSTVAFIPLMLYGLDLAAAGWRPIDAALFGAILGSTDAVAVTAILKAGAYGVLAGRQLQQ